MTDRCAGPPATGFRQLLARLDSDPERAGAALERIRRSLLKFFDWRGVAWPEERADETLDRLARKVEQGVGVADVAALAHGIARMVLQEAHRADARHEPLGDDPPDVPDADPRDREAMARALDRCLEALPEQGRELVLAYYSKGTGRGKIRSRQQLARELGLRDHALRSRVQRLRDRLEACVRNILAEHDTQ